MAVHIGNDYWTTRELASRLKCDVKSVCRYVKGGRLKGVVKVPLDSGKSIYLIPKQDVSGLGGPRGRRRLNVKECP